MVVNRTADLWWEARNSHKPNGVAQSAKSVIQSLPGRPTQTAFRTPALLGRNDPGLVVDLNKYRPGRDLKAYQDAGVDFFILRIGGPSKWVEGDYKYQEDVTYKPYLEQLDKLGLLGQSIGYIVHNPFEPLTVNSTTGKSIHTQLIDEWTSGGYMPQAFVYDHEVAECWRGNTKITCTAPNLVNSLAFNTDNTWKIYRRVVGIYTARWFINQYGLTNHVAYLDNVNKSEASGGPGTQRPMWYAWYSQTWSKQYTDLDASLDELVEPTTTQTNNLLQCGSYSLYDLWQYTYTLKLAGDAIGVDASVTRGSKADFIAMFGLKPTGTTPPPPVEPPVEPPATGDFQAQLDALKLAFANHTHGKPV